MFPLVDCCTTPGNIMLTAARGLAPVPRKKEGRAARLAAMMEQDGSAPPSSDADGKDVAGGDKEDAVKENVEPGKLQLPGKGKESLAEEGTN